MKNNYYLLLLVISFQMPVAIADSLQVATASNFLITLKKIAHEFKKETGHTVQISAASTGKIFAQISHGAPYDLFFSADQKRIDLLNDKNLIHKSKVYAIGQLVFIAHGYAQSQCQSALMNIGDKKLAIANPKTAPYGQAAYEVINQLGSWHKLQKNLLTGENILQTYQFIVQGNVAAGFVANTIVLNDKTARGYCTWLVPRSMYTPIKQKVGLMRRAKDNLLANDFYHYLQTPAIRELIEKNGYYHD